jgi:crossover junction endodeoxyribonuclease RuvC
MIVLGIDPGTATVGYSFVSGTKQKPVVYEYGVLRTLPVSKDLAGERLLEIGQDLEELIKKYKPDKAVVEDLFFFKNQKTVISVAQSKGMMLYILASQGIDTVSVTPLQAKQTLCGYGRATKLQMQKMVQKVFGFESLPKPDDAADSLAMAWWGL